MRGTPSLDVEHGVGRLLDATRRRGTRLFVGLGLTLLAALLSLGQHRVPEIEALDRVLYDATVRLFVHHSHDDRIAIVDIDEASLARHGRFPWPRDLIATLIEELSDRQGARVIGLDIVMSEPERNPIDPLLPLADEEARTVLRRIAPRLDRDRRLAEALSHRSVVLGYYLTSDREGHRSGELPQPMFGREARSLIDVAALRFDGFGGNLGMFMRSAAAAGYFNPIIDEDGKVRSVPLLAELDGELYESFSLAVARTYLGEATVTLRPGELVLEGKTGAAIATVDDRTAAWMPFFGFGGPSAGSFDYYSASDVLSGNIKPGTLHGKIVLVGTTSPGLVDSRPTPVASTFPGVELHANLVRGVLDGRLPHVPESAPGMGAIVCSVIGVGLTLGMTWMGALGSLGVAGLMAFALVTTYGAWYSQLGWIVPIGPALVLIAVLALWMIVAGYIAEGRARRQMVRLFSEYLPPELVRRLARDPARYRTEGDLREMTVVFADLSGFTGIAERLPPSELRQLLNNFLTAMSAEVFNHGGTLDKYIGDAVMAFWGAPLADDRHAEHAVECGLAMLRAMDRVNRECDRRGWPRLSVGIGINTGPMRVGDMGSSLRRAYTVIGDAVNVAARLQELSKLHQHRIIVGERTVDAVRKSAGAGSMIGFEPLGPAQLHGRQYQVEVFAVHEVLDPGVAATGGTRSALA